MFCFLISGFRFLLLFLVLIGVRIDWGFMCYFISFRLAKSLFSYLQFYGVQIQNMNFMILKSFIN